jgi:hypothetical protein
VIWNWRPLDLEVLLSTLPIPSLSALFAAHPTFWNKPATGVALLQLLLWFRLHMATTPAAPLVSATLRPPLPASDGGIRQVPCHQRSRSLPQWRLLARSPPPLPPPPQRPASGAPSKVPRQTATMQKPAVDHTTTRERSNTTSRPTRTRDSAPLGFESPSTLSQPPVKKDCEFSSPNKLFSLRSWGNRTDCFHPEQQRTRGLRAMRACCLLPGSNRERTRLLQTRPRTSSRRRVTCFARLETASGSGNHPIDRRTTSRFQGRQRRRRIILGRGRAASPALL